MDVAWRGLSGGSEKRKSCTHMNLTATCDRGFRSSWTTSPLTNSMPELQLGSGKQHHQAQMRSLSASETVLQLSEAEVRKVFGVNTHKAAGPENLPGCILIWLMTLTPIITKCLKWLIWPPCRKLIELTDQQRTPSPRYSTSCCHTWRGSPVSESFSLV